jgi:hypothetical protein
MSMSVQEQIRSHLGLTIAGIAVGAFSSGWYAHVQVSKEASDTTTLKDVYENRIKQLQESNDRLQESSRQVQLQLQDASKELQERSAACDAITTDAVSKVQVCEAQLQQSSASCSARVKDVTDQCQASNSQTSVGSNVTEESQPKDPAALRAQIWDEIAAMKQNELFSYTGVFPNGTRHNWNLATMDEGRPCVLRLEFSEFAPTASSGEVTFFTVALRYVREPIVRRDAFRGVSELTFTSALEGAILSRFGFGVETPSVAELDIVGTELQVTQLRSRVGRVWDLCQQLEG